MGLILLLAVRRHGEKVAIYKPGSGLSPDTGSAVTVTLDFPASRAMRNKCLLFIGHPASDILLEQPKLRHLSHPVLPLDAPLLLTSRTSPSLSGVSPHHLKHPFLQSWSSCYVITGFQGPSE